jgi:TrkA domain protein
VDVTQTMLPGIGLRYEFALDQGSKLCIVATRHDQFILSTFDGDDPDVGRQLLELDEEEAVTLAEILGAPRIAFKIAELTEEIPGLASEPIEIGSGSAFDGKTLGDTQARTRTGASVVALVRDDRVIASPTPQQPLQAGDVLVVIGTKSGIAKLEELLGVT